MGVGQDPMATLQGEDKTAKLRLRTRQTAPLEGKMVPSRWTLPDQLHKLNERQRGGGAVRPKATLTLRDTSVASSLSVASVGGRLVVPTTHRGRGREEGGFGLKQQENRSEWREGETHPCFSRKPLRPRGRRAHFSKWADVRGGRRVGSSFGEEGLSGSRGPQRASLPPLTHKLGRGRGGLVAGMGGTGTDSPGHWLAAAGPARGQVSWLVLCPTHVLTLLSPEHPPSCWADMYHTGLDVTGLQGHRGFTVEERGSRMLEAAQGCPGGVAKPGDSLLSLRPVFFVGLFFPNEGVTAPLETRGMTPRVCRHHRTGRMGA